MQEEYRVCRVCGETKPISGFRRTGIPFKTGPKKGTCPIRRICKTCVHRQIRRRQTERGLLQRQVSTIIDNTRRRNPSGTDRDITRAWLREKLTAGHCEVTGIAFDYTKKIFKPSIDRIDPNLGYTKDNCRIVCLGLNMMKSDCSDQDVLTLATAIIANAGKLRGNGFRATKQPLHQKS